MRRVGLAALLCLVSTLRLQAQLQTSVVSGQVFAPDGMPRPKAEVSLRDPLGQALVVASADDEGRFLLRGVAPGVYHLQASASALRSPSQRLAVRDGLPAEIDLHLSAQLSESVSVAEATSEPGGTTLAGEAVRRTPAANAAPPCGPPSARRRAGPRKTTACCTTAAPTTGSCSCSTAFPFTSASIRSSE